MNRKEQLIATEGFVRQKSLLFDSSHDLWHLERVRKMALFINRQEYNADPFELEIAALLHDIADSKFAGDQAAVSFKALKQFMDGSGMEGISEHVLEIIMNVSFSNKKNSGNLQDPILLMLQDADRLDAIGAIGIARAFNYGGFRNRSIYIPAIDDQAMSKSTIAHFYEKLLKLKDMMNTQTARQIAEERHFFLVRFLEQFYNEWEFCSFRSPS